MADYVQLAQELVGLISSESIRITLGENFKNHIETQCSQSILSGEWTNIRRVVLMNYKTKLVGTSNLSRDTLYANLRGKGVTTIYEPAVYPAVKIYFPETKWIAKVFRTGQIILTGMTTHDECASLVTQLKPLLVV
jgi:hypothetical protein